MNSSEIFAGEFYAWYRNRPKGQIPLGAAKVKVNHTRRTKDMYDKNRRTEVNITVVEKGTAYSMNFYEEGKTVTVPARELVDYWNEYKDEVAHLEAMRRLHDYKQKKAGSRKKALASLIGAKLAPMGLPEGTVRVESNWDASISLEAMLRWLRISESEIEAEILEAIGPPPQELSNGYTTN